MKYDVEDSRYADPEKAASRLMELAHAVEPAQEGRIYTEKVRTPFLFEDLARPGEWAAGLKLAVDRGWLWMHESGTYVKIMPEGAQLFAPRGAG